MNGLPRNGGTIASGSRRQIFTLETLPFRCLFGFPIRLPITTPCGPTGGT